MTLNSLLLKKRIFVLFLVTGFSIVSISYNATRAMFTDAVVSTNNTFQTAEFFPQTAQLFESNGFTCSTGATDTTIDKGDVVFSRDTTTLDITVTLSGALPNTTYQLWINQDPGGCPQSSPTVASFVTTDGSGNGEETLENHPIVSGATKFWVSIVGGSQVLRSTAINF